MSRLLLLLVLFPLHASVVLADDVNALIVEQIKKMPKGGNYAGLRKDLPEADRYRDLYRTVADLGEAIAVNSSGGLAVIPARAEGYSFCSSATYLLFCDVIAGLQRTGLVQTDDALSRELADIGDKGEVIRGKRDGIGLFGHWNADGPGTAVLFERLDLGTNFTDFSRAKPGDFLKIFWNEFIGKGEKGHLVVYLGQDPVTGAVEVWSSNVKNADGSSGYGTMWIERSRIVRALFSRLERPENLVNWLSYSVEERRSDYLVRIREVPSTELEMMRATRAGN
ncbi:MAG: hypothetical protein KA152_02620 [Verrucomicrobiales bacterium]|mgnify:CR=1 FL=1|nr:hypothetical protein [Verrucomicrobiales bacterium]